MRKFNITVNGQAYEVEVEEVGGAVSAAPVRAATPVAAAPAPAAAPAAPKAAPAAPKAAAGAGDPVKSPMPGNILDVKVKVGDKVTNGTCLVVLEAMKMENEIPAPKDGTVTSVLVNKGATVSAGDVLVTLA